MTLGKSPEEEEISDKTFAVAAAAKHSGGMMWAVPAASGHALWVAAGMQAWELVMAAVRGAVEDLDQGDSLAEPVTLVEPGN